MWVRATLGGGWYGYEWNIVDTDNPVDVDVTESKEGAKKSAEWRKYLVDNYLTTEDAKNTIKDTKSELSLLWWEHINYKTMFAKELTLLQKEESDWYKIDWAKVVIWWNDAIKLDNTTNLQWQKSVLLRYVTWKRSDHLFASKWWSYWYKKICSELWINEDDANEGTIINTVAKALQETWYNYKLANVGGWNDTSEANLTKVNGLWENTDMTVDVHRAIKLFIGVNCVNKDGNAWVEFLYRLSKKLSKKMKENSKATVTDIKEAKKWNKYEFEWEETTVREIKEKDGKKVTELEKSNGDIILVDEDGNEIKWGWSGGFEQFKIAQREKLKAWINGIDFVDEAATDWFKFNENLINFSDDLVNLSIFGSDDDVYTWSIVKKTKKKDGKVFSFELKATKKDWKIVFELKEPKWIVKNWGVEYWYDTEKADENKDGNNDIITMKKSLEKEIGTAVNKWNNPKKIKEGNISLTKEWKYKIDNKEVEMAKFKVDKDGKLEDMSWDGFFIEDGILFFGEKKNDMNLYTNSALKNDDGTQLLSDYNKTKTIKYNWEIIVYYWKGGGEVSEWLNFPLNNNWTLKTNKDWYKELWMDFNSWWLDWTDSEKQEYFANHMSKLNDIHWKENNFKSFKKIWDTYYSFWVNEENEIQYNFKNIEWEVEKKQELLEAYTFNGKDYTIQKKEGFWKWVNVTNKGIIQKAIKQWLIDKKSWNKRKVKINDDKYKVKIKNK